MAVELIPAGSTLFIDFGTTTNIFAKHIKDLPNLTVFTNSHLIAATMSENSSGEVFVLGGRYDDQIKANLGPVVIDGIGRFFAVFAVFADFAVIGIGGVDPKIGFSGQNIDEAAVARAMIARSNKSNVLADPSKFNRHGIAHVATLSEIDYLVSSEAPDARVCSSLAEVGVSLRFPG